MVQQAALTELAESVGILEAAFGIERTAEDDWFDPHLTVDTKLFIDPLLQRQRRAGRVGRGRWAGGCGAIV